MGSGHGGNITASLPCVLGKRICAPLHCSGWPPPLEGGTLLISPGSVLAKLKKFDACGRVVCAMLVFDGIREEYPHDLNDHVGHAGSLAAGIAPLFNVPSLEQRYRFVPVQLSQWLED